MAAKRRTHRVKTSGESARKIRIDPKSLLSAALGSTIRRSVRSAVRQEIASLRGRDWLSPQQPVGTFRPEDQASDWRTWDYPPGYNVAITPRKYEPYTFAQLRWLARNLDLLREVIERRKNEVAKLPWDIVARRGAETEPDEIAATLAVLRYPDGETPFTASQNATAGWPRTWHARRPCLPWPTPTKCAKSCCRFRPGAALIDSPARGCRLAANYQTRSRRFS